MNKCELFIDLKMVKNCNDKTKSIIQILCLVFIQFVIICISVNVRLAWFGRLCNYIIPSLSLTLTHTSYLQLLSSRTEG